MENRHACREEARFATSRSSNFVSRRNSLPFSRSFGPLAESHKELPEEEEEEENEISNEETPQEEKRTGTLDPPLSPFLPLVLALVAAISFGSQLGAGGGAHVHVSNEHA